MYFSSIELFDQETKEFFIKRSIILHWLGIIVFPLFSLLDFLVTKNHFLTFLLWRVSFVLLLTTSLFQIKKYHSYPLAALFTMACCLIGTGLIALMCLVMGENGTIYYGGIILIMISAAGLLPLTMKQAIISGFAFLGVYILFQFTSGRLSFSMQQILFSNSFFFLSFIIVTSILCHENSKARLRQFLLRNSVESLASQLSSRTRNLQSSIESRMKKIEESKIRYQYLYDNISDFVILIEKNGALLLANSTFNTTFAHAAGKKDKRSFFDTVYPADLPVLENDILKRLHHTRSVANVEFRLRVDEKNSLEVECNARRIDIDTDVLGYQLIMRDISARKKMQHELQNSQHQVAEARMATILGLAQLAEYRDRDTGTHLQHIQEYSRILAEELSTWPKYQGHVTTAYTENIYYASILHDIGKVGIPDAILLKEGKLDEEEFSTMKQHTQIGGDVLEAVVTKNTERSFLTMGKKIAYSHHERWDGSGYPLGLQAEEIPLCAAIVALADVYDALTSKRCYKPVFSHDKAKQIIIEGSKKHFSPDIVTAFLNKELDFIESRKNILVQTQ